jgi:hypothetical protein
MVRRWVTSWSAWRTHHVGDAVADLEDVRAVGAQHLTLDDVHLRHEHASVSVSYATLPDAQHMFPPQQPR